MKQGPSHTLPHVSHPSLKIWLVQRAYPAAVCEGYGTLSTVATHPVLPGHVVFWFFCPAYHRNPSQDASRPVFSITPCWIAWRSSAMGRELDFAVSRSRVQILLEAMLRNNLG